MFPAVYLWGEEESFPFIVNFNEKDNSNTFLETRGIIYHANTYQVATACYIIK